MTVIIKECWILWKTFSSIEIMAEFLSLGPLPDVTVIHWPFVLVIVLLWRDSMAKTRVERKHLMEDLLMLSKVSPWPSWWRALQQAGRQVEMVLELQLRAHISIKNEPINSQLWVEEGPRDYYLSLLNYLLWVDLGKGGVVTVNCFHWWPYQTPVDRIMLIKGHADGLG